MVTILMMWAKIATQGILKISLFWNIDYNVITFVYEITDEILSRGSNFIVDVVMWPKFDNSIIRMRKVIITLIL